MDARSVVVGLEAKKGRLVDFDITRFELHDIAGTRRLVRFDTAALDGGIRRRKLLVLADEPGNVLLCKRAVADALGNRGGTNRLALGIVGVGRHAECYAHVVGFIMIGHVRIQAGRRAHADAKRPCQPEGRACRYAPRDALRKCGGMR